MANLLNIGVSGLRVSQTSLQVTGNNISNANVPYFSRQRAEVATLPEQLLGNGYVGAGAAVTDINRIVDTFLIKQVQFDTASFQRLDTYTTNLNQIDSLLADELTGVNSALESFYEAIEAGATDPTSIPARQLAVSLGQSLAERFNTLDERVSQQGVLINQQLAILADQATSLARGIADLNMAIEQALGGGNGAEPNQLLDERDELIRQLAEIVTVKTVQEPSGSMNVFIGSGQPLVVGNFAGQLDTVSSSNEPGDVDIVYVGSSTAQRVTDQVTGGQMGGLLDFRDDVLSETLNSLGRIAVSVADTLNAQHRKGLDFNGEFGGNFFTDVNTASQMADRSFSDTNNTGTGSAAIAVTDVNLLTTSDYTLVVTAAGYDLIRDSDNAIVGSGALPAAPGSITTTEGFQIDLQAGTYNAGDVFYIRPTRFGARDIGLEVQEPQQLAYASPITTDASLGNIGTGKISPGQVIDVYDANGATLAPFATPGALSPPLLIRFTSPTTYNILDNSNPAAPVVITTGAVFNPGQVNTVTIGTPPAYSVELTGTPQTGDRFTIDFNGAGISDNRNATALGATRIANTMEGGTISFEEAYGRLVEEVGAQTAKSRVATDAAESLLAQSQGQRDALSGVNLDEEAANLIKFEQAYNASAQVINVARQIFDTLLAAFR